MTAMHVGIDFGTTNSAVAIAHPGQPAEIVPLRGPAGTTPTPTWRTLLCFEHDDERVRVSAGAEGIARFAASGGEARLVQSFKSYLASATFTGTTILGRRW